MGIKKPTTIPFNTQRSIQRLADNRRSLQTQPEVGRQRIQLEQQNGAGRSDKRGNSF